MKPPPPDVRLLDVTLRDGAFLFGHDFPPDLLEAIVSCLDGAGMPYIEIGHGVSVGDRARQTFGGNETDVERARAARAAVMSARLGMVAHASYAAEKDLEELKPYLDFIRIGTNADNPQEAADLVEKAKALGYEVFFQMIRTSRVTPRQAAETAKFVTGLGADVVYLVDSGGIWSPWQVEPYVSEIRSSVEVPLGIHAHDHLGTALANTLEAVRSGCQWADGSLRGIGRGAGNVQMELLNVHLRRLGCETGVEEEPLGVISEMLQERLPERRGVSSSDFLPASQGIDLFPVSFFFDLCRKAGIQLKDLIQAFARMPHLVEIGVEDIAKALESLGVDAASLLHEMGIQDPNRKAPPSR